jgi:hypothetical protein
VLQFNADAGSDDDIIQLLAGTYHLTIQNAGGRHETAGLTGDLNLTRTSHRWIIQGAGTSTIIDASQLQDRVFQIVNPGTQVVFQDLVIQGGLAQDDGTDGALAGTSDALGGGILNNGGDVTLDHVVVQNNVARGGDVASLGVSGHNANGGGIYSTGGALTLAGATLANNQASGGRGGDYGGDGGLAAGGGLYATGGSLDISDSMVTSNRGTGGRGGDGYLTYGYTTFGGTYRYYTGGGRGGSATGGGLYVNGSSLTIASSAIATNQATGGKLGLGGSSDGVGEAGGLYNLGTLTVSDSTLSGNSANLGGGIFNDHGTLTVSNSTLSGNSAGSGGGIYNWGTLTVSDSTLSGNTGVYGGGIYNNSGRLTVSNSTLSGNSAGDGGGIYNTGTLTVTGSTLSGNSAGDGGGIYNEGNMATLTLSSSTLSGNSARSGGGGIFINGGTMTVSNSTLSGNSTSSYGGGIYNYGTLTVTNSTLSGNSASYYGGGIYNGVSRQVTLTNVTLTANRANRDGGGLFVDGGSSDGPLLHNTLIAGNFRTDTTRNDIHGRLNPGGDYNLIGDGTGMTGLSNGVNGNQIGSAGAPIDPLLGPLQDNGGPTLTHALLSGSPAIDAGNNAYATYWDQRGEGFPRIVNGIIDIGAFEYQGDGAAPLFSRSVRVNEPAVGTLLASLPPSNDQPVILSSVPTSHQDSTVIEPDRVRASAAATWDPKASSADTVFALFQERAPGQVAAWWDDLEAGDGMRLIGY